MGSRDSRGFFGSLFDFRFRFFITSKLIRLLYVLAFIFAVVAYLGLVVGAFFESTTMGLLAIFIIGPIAFLLLLIYARVMLELVMVLFSIAENVEALSQSRPTPKDARPQVQPAVAKSQAEPMQRVDQEKEEAKEKEEDLKGEEDQVQEDERSQ